MSQVALAKEHAVKQLTLTTRFCPEIRALRARSAHYRQPPTASSPSSTLAPSGAINYRLVRKEALSSLLGQQPAVTQSDIDNFFESDEPSGRHEAWQQAIEPQSVTRTLCAPHARVERRAQRRSP